MQKALIYIFCSLLLCSCGVSNNNNPSSIAGTSNSSSLLQISNISTIPTANSTPREYVYLRLSNYLNNNLTLINTTIQANGKELPNSDIPLFVDLTGCLTLVKRSTCNFKVFTTDKYQSYLLTLTFNDNNGNTLTTKQIISFNNLLPNQNGFVYDANALTSNNSGLVVPFRLTNNYNSIDVLINNHPAKFSCFNNSYQANTLCSANVGSLWLSGTNDQIKIIGYDNNSKIIANTILVLTNNNVGNLVTSGVNIVVNPDDGTNPQTVYLLNNGNNTVSNLTITPLNPISLTSSTCGSSLAANASCSFVINVSGSVTSGQSSVAVSYSNGQNSQILFFNVGYINQNTPGLTLTTSGNFNNLIQNSGIAYISVNIYNSGSVNLTNMQFSNLNLQESSMTSFATNSTCSNGGSLAVGQSCLINLSYIPTAVESGTVNFIPLANYAGSDGQTLSYANSILNISYSTIASPSFVLAGDLGTISSSSNYPPSTWAANIDSPFTSTTESANGMIINSGTYAMVLNSGRVVYSESYALFWKNAANTNFKSSQCGLAYDGTNYYTCGVESTTSGVCTANFGCIIYANSFTSSWNIATGGSTIAGDDVASIAYFVDNANKAYVAGPVRNGGYSSNRVTASTTGTSGWVTIGAGSIGAGGPARGFVYNTTTKYVTFWILIGGSGSSQESTVTSPWNCCTNNVSTPESSASGSVIANGIYYIANSLGKIYLTTDPKNPPAQAYTIVYSGGGGTPLNAIGYGNNELLAAGNSGAIVESFAGSGFSAKSSLVISQNTNPSLYSVYFESVNSNFWVTGVNALAYTPVAATPSWTIPAISGITKYTSGSTNTYLAIDNQKHIFSSTNLTSWNLVTNPSNQVLNDIVCSELKTCIAVGQNGTILKSTDGLTWTQLSSPTTANLTSVACQLGSCIAVGGTGAANSGIVLLSTNTLTNWVIANSSIATTQLNAIAFFGERLMIVGNNGTIFTSTNGYDWQSQSSLTTNNLNGISCSLNIGICVAVGESGTIVSSFTLSGGGWSSATSNTTNSLTSVINNGVFVAVGKAGTIRYSSTGSGSWSTGTFPSVATTNLWGVISK